MGLTAGSFGANPNIWRMINEPPGNNEISDLMRRAYEPWLKKPLQGQAESAPEQASKEVPPQRVASPARARAAQLARQQQSTERRRTGSGAVFRPTLLGE